MHDRTGCENGQWDVNSGITPLLGLLRNLPLLAIMRETTFVQVFRPKLRYYGRMRLADEAYVLKFARALGQDESCYGIQQEHAE